FGPGLRSDFKSTILKTGLYMKLNVKIQSLAKIFIDILVEGGLVLTDSGMFLLPISEHVTVKPR
ncbi:MAG: hypothetical protein RBT65_16955, partial [Methanolobus sp.]|nr:hypothetical protein [Methanolobus sp.]